MRQISRSEAESWLTYRGYAPYQTELGDLKWLYEIDIPHNYRRHLALSALIRELAADGTQLFATTDIGIWPSAGNRFIFDRFLSSGGIDCDNASEVFVLMQPDDQEYLEGGIYLSLLFVYGGFIAMDGGLLIIGWSHDEFLYINGDKNRCEMVEKLLIECLGWKA